MADRTRLVFMGTPEFALPSIAILLDHRYDVASVVTVPDRPAGRGLGMRQSPVKRFALQHGLPILTPEKLKDPQFIEQLRSVEPDIFVIVAFRILPKEVFSIPKLGAFNLHASLLPKYRGAAPINWAIMKGEQETGVTTFFLQESVDTGALIFQESTGIGPDDTAGDLHDRLANLGASVVLQTVQSIESGAVSLVSQDDSLATAAPKISSEDCRIDWTRSTQEVHNFIRGLSPKPGAYTFLESMLLKIYRSKIVAGTPNAVPGRVLAVDRRLVVNTGDGAIELLEIQLQGKKRLTAEEFLRGNRLPPGTQFLS